MANILNEYFSVIADWIGFDDPIPIDYDNDVVLRAMIVKHDNHQNIQAIKDALPYGNIFKFCSMTEYEIYNIHYSDVIMSTMTSQITSLTIVYSAVFQTQIKENIKAPCHWHLRGKFTGDRWIPCTKGQ